MDPNVNEQKSKKGFLSAIWESMTRTGGCCGSGGNCCGSSRPDNGTEKSAKKRDDLQTKNAAK